MVGVARRVVLAFVPALGGCSIALTPVATFVPDSARQWSAGHRLTATLHPNRDAGPVVGIEAEQLWGVGEAPIYSPDQHRTQLIFGYATLPLPHRSSFIGLEALGDVGFGQYHRRGEVVDAPDLGLRVGTPMRLSGWKEVWNSEATLAGNWFVVPTLGAALYWPVNPDADHGTGVELSGGIAVRFHLWTSLVP